MAKKRVEAVISYPERSCIAASVATTKTMIVLALGDGREEHYTYPPDGKFHITPDARGSAHSFFAPGPSFDELDYRRLAIVAVPLDHTELVRTHQPSPAQSMTLPAPTTREGILEIGILGKHADPQLRQSLESDDAILGLFQGPRSDTTIVLRYTL